MAVLVHIAKEFLIPCIVCFGGTLAFSVVYNVPRRLLLLASLGGTVGWFVFLLFKGVFPNDLPQYFLAAFVIAAYAEIMARVQKNPAIVYLMPGLFPLVPGGPIYYTMEAALSGNNIIFMDKLIYTFEIAGSIALGVLLSTAAFQLIFSRLIFKIPTEGGSVKVQSSWTTKVKSTWTPKVKSLTEIRAESAGEPEAVESVESELNTAEALEALPGARESQEGEESGHL